VHQLRLDSGKFEAGVREIGLQAAEELLSLGDTTGAEELLRTLIRYMPEDEEMIELHIRGLEASGKKTEAMCARNRLSTVEV